MPSKNLLLNSLKESFSSISKNKLLFIFLFIFQIIFFAVFSYVTYTYQTKILESAQAITEYLSQQKLDELSVADNLLQQKSILGDDPLSISRNFNEMIKNFKLYLIYTFILLVIFTSISWTLTVRLIYGKKILSKTKIFFKNMAVMIFYLGLIFLFFFSLLNISFADVAAESSRLLTKYVTFLIISIVLIYFMLISLSLAHNTGWKNIVQKTLIIGIKKSHYILAAYLISVSLLAVSVISLAYFIEKNLFVLLLSLILMVFSFVFGRVLLASVVRNLIKDRNI